MDNQQLRISKKNKKYLIKVQRTSNQKSIGLAENYFKVSR